LIDDERFTDYNEKAWKVRMDMLTYICQQEFHLVYYGHFNYNEIDELTVHEREMIYSMLIDQKKQEQEAYDKAIQEAKQKSKERRTSSPRHHHH
jgi:hypothetical protein